jgi:hypothetical protein
VTPIVRVGNVALMPNPREPVWIEWYGRKGWVEAYLIECRSLGGLSGSPAFISLPTILWIPGGSPIPGGQFRPVLNYQYHWIGLVHGHWKGDKTVLDAAQDSTKRVEPLNTGIAIVIPSKVILDVINQPRLVEMRKAAADKSRSKNAPTPDDVSSPSKPTQKTRAGIDIPIPTREQVEDVFKKASQKRKP